MMHCTLDQLIELRDGGSEPGLAEARTHLAQCEACTAELDRLHQRVARLRALPTLRPARSQWSAIANRRRHEQLGRRIRQGGWATLAAAASVSGALVVGPMLRAEPSDGGVTAAAIAEAQQQSAQLEQAIDALDPAARPIDGQTARVAQALEDRIAELDQRIQVVELAPARNAADSERLGLWEQRVGLMDALVDVHLTSASDVGL